MTENVLTVRVRVRVRIVPRLQIHYCYNLIKMGHSLFERSVIWYIGTAQCALISIVGPFNVSLSYCPIPQMD